MSNHLVALFHSIFNWDSRSEGGLMSKVVIGELAESLQIYDFFNALDRQSRTGLGVLLLLFSC
jgi:hypothetical protein